MRVCLSVQCSAAVPECSTAAINALILSKESERSAERHTHSCASIFVRTAVRLLHLRADREGSASLVGVNLYIQSMVKKAAVTRNSP